MAAWARAEASSGVTHDFGELLTSGEYVFAFVDYPLVAYLFTVKFQRESALLLWDQMLLSELPCQEFSLNILLALWKEFDIKHDLRKSSKFTDILRKYFIFFPFALNITSFKSSLKSGKSKWQ